MQLMEYTQLALFLGLLALMSPVLGRFIGRAVLRGEQTWLHSVLGPVERLIYRASGIRPEARQSWRQYAASLCAFSAAGFLMTFGVLMLQDKLPLNPQGFSGLSWHLAFNTAVSFLTNTNWQSYAGESTVSHFSQMVGLAYHNFVSAAAGLAVAVAVMRGLASQESKTIGNFWADLVRSVLYVLLPISLVLAVVLVGQGVVQTMSAGTEVATLEGGRQFIAMGPTASQVAIKMLGTNGGGFFNANAAHPLENPTALSNLLQMLAIFIIPSSLVFTLGGAVSNRRHAWTVWFVMACLFMVGAFSLYRAETLGTPLLTEVAQAPVTNMEGKEVRFGIFGSAMFATVTTDASCGAVNAMHDSLTPLGGLVTLVNMQMGEVIFGGVGSGLYGMVLFILLTVFLAGLMVGRTPDYLGKRIEGREVTLAMLALIIAATPPLLFSAVAAVSGWGQVALNNAGAHGFSEILYAYTSGVQNNGSAFAGLNANSPAWNVTLALAMLIGRFGVMLPMLGVAGSMASRRARPIGEFSFPVSGFTFGLLLTLVIVIVGALTYLPALALGPVVEHFQMLDGLLH